MHFVSLGFAIFFLFVLPLNWLLKPYKNAYRCFLLAASAFFYGSFNLWFLAILFHFSLWTWYFALLIADERDQAHKTLYLVLNLIIGLAGLVFFKYYELFFSMTDFVFVHLHVKNPFPILDLVLPVGISFFTFQGLSYAMDVYRDRQNVVKNPLDILVYISFFPTILSGPILRAKGFIAQLADPGSAKSLDESAHARAYLLLVSGLFKKMFLSSYLLEHIVSHVFEVPESHSSATVLLGAFAYSVQIYADFSGYTDLATGVALLMGFSLPPNFNAPYRALNLRDFWSRWHISFSTWLRDYLYISLGGNRKGPLRRNLNLILTFGLGGLWHGASLSFLVWGLLHGFGLMVTHTFRDWRARAQENKPQPGRLTQGALAAASWALTFCFVTLAWIFFRAENADQAMNVIKRILAFDASGAPASPYVLPLVAVVLLAQFSSAEFSQALAPRLARVPSLALGLIFGLAFAVILMLGPDGVPPFIYFQF